MFIAVAACTPIHSPKHTRADAGQMHTRTSERAQGVERARDDEEDANEADAGDAKHSAGAAAHSGKP